MSTFTISCELQGLYAKCPRTDKIKIARVSRFHHLLLFGSASTHIKDQCVFHLQGIVAAIRQLGGRFLELNDGKKYYFDIGDKKVR